MTRSAQDSLLALGQSIGDASLGALRKAVGPGVTIGEVSTLVDADSVGEQIVTGVVVADAGSTDGAAGRSLLVLSQEHAHVLAGAEAPTAPESGAEIPASPAMLEAVVAVADAVNAAAAEALTLLLGTPVGYAPAEAAIVEDPRFVLRPGPVQALCVSFVADALTCRLIQFAPNALLMRATQAFENLAQHAALGFAGETSSALPAQSLSGIRLRVWAELGRTELGLAEALALPLGSVVELDREADAPVELVVNGLRFGTGHLIVTDEGEWALALDEVGPPPVTAA
jgi:flagellar motor switch protein FliN/FliY